MAAESNFVQPAIPRFDGHYDHWSMLMENFLRSKEYWSLVENGIPAAAEGAELTEGQRKQIEDAKLKDLKVKNYLFQAIDRTIIETILNKETAKHIWDSMRQKYQGSTKVKRAQLQALRREFEVLQMKEGETVDEYFARTLTIANKMKAHSENMAELVIVEKILRSMTAKFDYVVCSIEESNNLTTMTIDELQSSLLVHEQRMRGHGGEEQALKVTYEDRTSGRGRGRGGFRGRGRGRSRQQFNKALVECYKCHKLGHFQYECPEWEKGANYAELDEKEEMLLMAYVELNNSKMEEVWFLDSGCSNHMSGNKKWFIDLNEQFRQSVKLGNNSKMAVMGKGNVRLQANGVTQVFTDVYYIPELKNNLLSIGQLQEKGVAILIQNGMCQIYHPRKGLIMQTKMSANRMFVILANMLPQASACFQTVSEDNTHLWHCRYGHLSFKGLKTLQYRNMVKGLPDFKMPSKLCKDCMVGKQHRESIPKKSMWRASHRLQLIHSDICGPIKPLSNNRKRYLISFIDDYSRKTWVYFLNEKSQAFTTFKSFKCLVEKETGDYIQCLRTDRGGEFTSQEFNTFCSTHGISRQLTAAYTPQQNGVAERKNRTIMNMVRSMLSEKQVPKVFWPEAVNWSIHILNRSPTLAVKDMTPEEAWSGIKPVVHYFKVFGCIAHVHIPEAKRKKLDNKSYKCVLLGVSEESKAYRLYDPISERIVVSRDVVFEEDESWEWGRTAEEVRLDVLDWSDGEEEENESAQSEEENEYAQSEEENVNNDDAEEEEEILEEGRTRMQPVWMQDYVSGEGLSEEEETNNVVMFTSVTDPATFEEAFKSAKWKAAMDQEIEAIERNHTWELTTLPAGAKTIGVKWIFKTKLNENGEVDKCKARLVAKGYAQQYGIDYTEVFAPVARWDTIRMVIALAAQKGWKVYQLDVKSAFLHGELTEAIFIDQPQGYVKKGDELKVYKLNKALYGLKQAPRAWYSRIEAYFIKEGFERCPHEHTLFVKSSKGGKILIKSMKDEFDMSDLGMMRYFLGVEVVQNEAGIYICQKKYASEILERFGMEKSNSVRNPIVPGFKLMKDEGGVKVDATMYKQIVGSLMYLTATRPDLMYVVSLISRFMSSPTELHMQAAKRVLRYLKGTINLGVLYRRNGEEKLEAFTDSDYAGDVDDRKSTSGYIFMFSDGAVSWSSKKQPVVTLSTTEAEFIAAAYCACQGVWMRRIFKRLGHTQRGCTTVYCDNSSTIKLSKNPVMHGRSKHIDVRFHFLRQLTNDGIVELVYCNTQDQIADAMTKPLKLDVFEKLRDLLGMCLVPGIN
ncbi:putative RNA-directed DNA polymerase [Rosa chinensis]|uniref:Putative RNA-directed DNA polymerase n=1 Tax=Rosa chinensis TaxID=74649 RepID=A0A2P6P744_ROSCH|nr:putative RNA-directed DNA polymerase [Rosa chinensis]